MAKLCLAWVERERECVPFYDFDWSNYSCFNLNTDLGRY